MGKAAKRFIKINFAHSNIEMVESTDPVEIMGKVRASLNARGVRTIRGMGRSFRIFDDNGDRKIDKQEFYWGLKDLGASISMREAQLLLQYLDTNQDGVVSYPPTHRSSTGNTRKCRTIYRRGCRTR